MAGHNGLIKTIFYFGVSQRRERFAVGNGGAAFCVQKALQDKQPESLTSPSVAAIDHHEAFFTAQLQAIKESGKTRNAAGPFKFFLLNIHSYFLEHVQRFYFNREEEKIKAMTGNYFHWANKSACFN